MADPKMCQQFVQLSEQAASASKSVFNDPFTNRRMYLYKKPWQKRFDSCQEELALADTPKATSKPAATPAAPATQGQEPEADDLLSGLGELASAELADLMPRVQANINAAYPLTEDARFWSEFKQRLATLEASSPLLKRSAMIEGEALSTQGSFLQQLQEIRAWVRQQNSVAKVSQDKALDLIRETVAKKARLQRGDPWEDFHKLPPNARQWLLTHGRGGKGPVPVADRHLLDTCTPVGLRMQTYPLEDRFADLDQFSVISFSSHKNDGHKFCHDVEELHEHVHRSGPIFCELCGMQVPKEGLKQHAIEAHQLRDPAQWQYRRAINYSNPAHLKDPERAKEKFTQAEIQLIEDWHGGYQLLRQCFDADSTHTCTAFADSIRTVDRYLQPYSQLGLVDAAVLRTPSSVCKTAFATYTLMQRINLVAIIAKFLQHLTCAFLAWRAQEAGELQLAAILTPFRDLVGWVMHSVQSYGQNVWELIVYAEQWLQDELFLKKDGYLTFIVPAFKELWSLLSGAMSALAASALPSTPVTDVVVGIWNRLNIDAIINDLEMQLQMDPFKRYAFKFLMPIGALIGTYGAYSAGTGRNIVPRSVLLKSSKMLTSVCWTILKICMVNNTFALVMTGGAVGTTAIVHGSHLTLTLTDLLCLGADTDKSYSTRARLCRTAVQMIRTVLALTTFHAFYSMSGLPLTSMYSLLCGRASGQADMANTHLISKVGGA